MQDASVQAMQRTAFYIVGKTALVMGVIHHVSRRNKIVRPRLFYEQARANEDWSSARTDIEERNHVLKEHVRVINYRLIEAIVNIRH